jgi:hypothetical protein
VPQALAEPFRQRLQHEVAACPFAPVPTEIGPVRQEIELCVVPVPSVPSPPAPSSVVERARVKANGRSSPPAPPAPPWAPAAARADYPSLAALCRAFVAAVRAHGQGIRGLERYAPNVAYVQRYRPGSLGVSPHRDGKRFALLVAVFTTHGSASFSLCRGRSGGALATWEAGPGSLALLRGPGLGGLPDGRPFHTVAGPACGERYSVTIRMDTLAALARPDTSPAGMEWRLPTPPGAAGAP